MARADSRARRAPANLRRYPEPKVYRVQFVKHARISAFPWKRLEIKDLLSLCQAGCEIRGGQEAVQKKIEEVGRLERINALERNTGQLLHI